MSNPQREAARAIVRQAIAAAHAEGKTVRRKPGKLPPPRHPYSLEAELYRYLRDDLREHFRAIGEAIAADYPRLLADVQSKRPAASRHDALHDDLHRLFAPLVARWGRRAAAARPYLERILDRVNTRNMVTFQGQLRRVIGMDVIQHEPWLKDEMEAAAREAAGYIQDLGEKATERAEAIVSDGVRQGTSTKAIQEALRDEMGIGERRAALIAVDQIGKFNGNLNRLRQTQAGIDSYRWRTCGDARVRPAHRAREGQTFRWDTPPSDGHPGQPVRCRCTAEPVIDLFDDLLQRAAERTRARS